nr:MAG TPA: hypothetical protein [Caudoviricetes sp.]
MSTCYHHHPMIETMCIHSIEHLDLQALRH